MIKEVFKIKINRLKIMNKHVRGSQKNLGEFFEVIEENSQSIIIIWWIKFNISKRLISPKDIELVEIR